MKKTPKVLISVVLLAAMFCNIFSAFPFVTEVSAAGNGAAYEYVATNKIEAGKTYLIVKSGSDVALSTDGSSVSNGKVTVKDDKISDFSGSEKYEWTVVPGMAEHSYTDPKTGTLAQYLNATYMLQNPVTGAYLYNPVYDTGDGAGMSVTKNPLADSYSPYTRQVYNSQAAFNAYISANASGSAVLRGDRVDIGRKDTNDPNVNVSLGNIDDAKFIVSTVYNSGVNNMGFIHFGGNYGAPGFGGGESYNPQRENVLVNNSWNIFDVENLNKLTPGRLYNNIQISGNQSGIRFDIDCDAQLFLASTFTANNIHAKVALQYFRYAVSRESANGYYPSQTFPFSQFAFRNVGGNNFEISNFSNNDHTKALYSQEYYYGWNNDGFVRDWNNLNSIASNSSVFYEKRIVSEQSYSWQLVTNTADLENNAEYIITDSANLNGAFSFISGNASVSDANDVNSITEADTWRVASAGDYFYLINANGAVLYTNNQGDVLYVMNQGTSGNSVAYGVKYRFKYDFANGILSATTVAQNAGEQDTTSNIGIKGGNSYLFKKVYCAHASKTVQDSREASCLETGYTKYYCADCGNTWTETIPALGHIVATFVSDGDELHSYICSRCNEKVSEHHELSYNYEQENDASHTIKCSVCDYEKTEAHDIKTVTTAGDCSHPSTETKYCTKCSWRTYTEGDVADHSNDAGHVTVEPTCTKNGVLKFKCLVCGNDNGETVIPAYGHVWSDYYRINASTLERKCLFCGITETKTDSETNTDYVYVLVDTPVSGREYIVANTGAAGKAYAATSVDGRDASAYIPKNLISAPVSVNAGNAQTGTRPYIKLGSDAAEWTARSEASGFTFQNVNNGYYLWAENKMTADSSEWIHLNIGSAKELGKYSYFIPSAATAAGSGGGIINTGVGTTLKGIDGNYVGFKDIIDSKGFTIPGDNVLRFYYDDNRLEDLSAQHGYAPFSGYIDENNNSIWISNDENFNITGNVTVDVDFSLGNEHSCLILYRPGYSSIADIRGDRIEILGNGYLRIVNTTETNQKDYLQTVKLDNLTLGSGNWHHLRIESSENPDSTKIYIDGNLVASQDGWSFKSHCVKAGIDNPGNTINHKGIYIMAWIDPVDGYYYGKYPADSLYIDNINIVSGDIRFYDDFDGNGNIFYEGRSAVTEAIKNPQTVEPEVIDKNVFVSSGDYSNKVYLYEKQYKWTVEHYYDGVLDASLNDVGYKPVGETFKWTDKAKTGYTLKKHDANTVVTETGANVIKVYYEKAVSVNDDKFAISFANTAIEADRFTANDSMTSDVTNYKVNAVTSSVNGDVNTIYTKSCANGTSVNTNGVSVTYDAASKTVKVVTDKASDVNVSFFVEITFTLNGKTLYIYSKATVVSATSVYFEDNSGFITYNNGKLENGAAYSWTIDGANNAVTALYNEIYGYSDTYNNADYVRYSGAGSHKLTIPGETDYANEANASFTFTGTGFDVLSHCNANTGIIFVDVKDASGNVVKTTFVNTYLGYEYVNGEWVETENAGTTYQVPVIKVSGLDYGTYTVVVTPSYYRDFKCRTSGETYFWLDGVVIYDPMGDDSKANEIYGNDGELGAVIFDIGDQLVNGGAMSITSDINGVNVNDYKQYGPNHEVYLEKGNYVSFVLRSSEIPQRVVIGASSANGASCKLKATSSAGSVAEYTVSGGKDMYYNITSVLEWVDDGNGGYVTKAPVVITATGDGLLALTTAKISFSGANSASVLMSGVADDDAVSAVKSAIRRFVIAGDVSGDGVLSSNDSRLMKSHISYGTPLTYEQFAAADLSGDERITAIDRAMIVELFAEN